MFLAEINCIPSVLDGFPPLAHKDELPVELNTKYLLLSSVPVGTCVLQELWVQLGKFLLLLISVTAVPASYGLAILGTDTLFRWKPWARSGLQVWLSSVYNQNNFNYCIA